MGTVSPRPEGVVDDGSDGGIVQRACAVSRTVTWVYSRLDPANGPVSHIRGRVRLVSAARARLLLQNSDSELRRRTQISADPFTWKWKVSTNTSFHFVIAAAGDKEKKVFTYITVN